MATSETQTWTIKKIQEWSKTYFETNGIENPQLDVQLLLGHVLNMTKMQLLLQAERPLDSQELALYKQLILRRAKNREPIAYILGTQDFWSLKLKVTPSVLIPRADTECLVEKALEFARSRMSGKTLPWPAETNTLTYEDVDDRKSYYEAVNASEELEKRADDWVKNAGSELKNLEISEQIRAFQANMSEPSQADHSSQQEEKTAQSPLEIVDIGTGSGAIILALASELTESQANLSAIDISRAALDLAKENANQCGFLDRITWLEGNLLDPYHVKADIIVSNPPYISTDEMKELSPEVQKEPVLALQAGSDGLDIYRQLVPQAVQILKDGGALLVEIGYTQSQAVEKLFKENGLTQVRTFRDYGHQPRVVFGLKTAKS